MCPSRKIYLASTSQRRIDILNQYGLCFKQIPNKLINETFPRKFSNIKTEIRKIVLKKALLSKENYQGLILTFDTVIFFQGKIYGKPNSLETAKKFLLLFSGHTHEVITGLCIFDTIDHKIILRTETSKVTFKELNITEIDYYLNHFSVLDKAGAYAIQEYAKNFIQKIEGSYENIIGLPIKSLLKLLKKYDIV